MNFSAIKNLIFDLGGVIIDIDLHVTYNAFSKLAGKDVGLIVKGFRDLKIFENYQIGALTDQEFRDFIRQEFNPELTDEVIDHAWNALLLELPVARIELLKKLRKKYRIFLLSNINEIHLIKVNEILNQACGITALDELFEKVYYSHRIRMSKPSPDIYHYVLKDNKLKAGETVFIDDLVENLEGAKQAGLHVLHVQHPITILELLKNA